MATTYMVTDIEGGGFYREIFDTEDEAKKALLEVEENDKKEGFYAPDFYKIIKEVEDEDDYDNYFDPQEDERAYSRMVMEGIRMGMRRYK